METLAPADDPSANSPPPLYDNNDDMIDLNQFAIAPPTPPSLHLHLPVTIASSNATPVTSQSHNGAQHDSGQLPALAVNDDDDGDFVVFHQPDADASLPLNASAAEALLDSLDSQLTEDISALLEANETAHDNTLDTSLSEKELATLDDMDRYLHDTPADATLSGTHSSSAPLPEVKQEVQEVRGKKLKRRRSTSAE